MLLPRPFASLIGQLPLCLLVACSSSTAVLTRDAQSNDTGSYFYPDSEQSSDLDVSTQRDGISQGPDVFTQSDAHVDASPHIDAHPDVSVQSDAHVDAHSDAPALSDAHADVATRTDATDGSHGGPGPQYSAVQAIFDQHCVSCHDANRPPLSEGLSYPALPLTADVSYQTLVGKPAHETCGGVLVNPNDSAHSYLFHKLIDQPPCDGLPMPRSALRPMPLDPADVATIRAWIEAGARP